MGLFDFLRSQPSSSSTGPGKGPPPPRVAARKHPGLHLVITTGVEGYEFAALARTGLEAGATNVGVIGVTRAAPDPHEAPDAEARFEVAEVDVLPTHKGPRLDAELWGAAAQEARSRGGTLVARAGDAVPASLLAADLVRRAP